MLSGTWSLPWSIAVFVTAALVTIIGGVRLTKLGDVLADRSRLGEAFFGGIFFGGVISISGIVMTVTASLDGYPRMAYSNAVGGIAAQTAALGLADIAYRKANLEHASASLSNMLFAAVLVALLTLVVLATFVPKVTLFAIHPVSLLLVGAYLIGVRTVRRAQSEPLWIPKTTRETVEDKPPEQDPASGRTDASVWAEFAGLGLMVSLAGWAVARAAQGVVENTGLSQSFVAVLFMGMTNAMPETIVSITAVRRGALALAVSSVLGGNTFDVLNLVLGDAAYRTGSLYHAAGQPELFITLATILMTVILLAGMLRRESQGPAEIGWESTLLLVTYVLTIALIAFGANSQ